MVKKKKTNMVVGSNNIIRTAIPKQLNKLIIEFKLELEKKHKKPISKQWAALQLTMQIKNNGKK